MDIGGAARTSRPRREQVGWCGAASAAAAAMILVTGCTIGALPPEAPSTSDRASATPSATPDAPSPSPTSEDPPPPEPPPPGDDAAALGLDTFLAVSGDALSYQFDNRARTGSPDFFLATDTAGLVDLETGRAKLDIEVLASSPDIEEDLLDATGLSFIDELDMEVVLMGAGQPVLLTFPNRAVWNDRWLRISGEVVEGLLAPAGIYVDLTTPLAGQGWLGPARTVLAYDALGADGGWNELSVPAGDAAPYLPPSTARALVRAGAEAPSLDVDVPVYAQGSALEASMALDFRSLLAGAATAAPTLGLQGDQLDLWVESRMFDLDTPLGVPEPPPSQVTEEPFAPIFF